MKKSYFIIIIILSCCGTVYAQSDLKSIRKIIEQKNQIFIKASVTGDSALFASFHHSQTVNMPPDHPSLFGQGAIGGSVKYIPQSGIKDMTIDISAIYGGPEFIIEEGKYKLKTKNGQHDGKYVVIWKQEAGTCKIYRGIWNLDTKW